MRRRLALACAATLLALAACRSAPPPRAALLDERASEVAALESALRSAAAEPGALRLSLAFGADADLDLFVTGPLEETVYFANSPSAIGGRLDADLRCDAPAPRVETVTFPVPPPGRYRIGVDFPRACGESEAGAVFAVAAEGADGEVRAAGSGVIRPGEFLAVVLEVTVP